MSKTELTAKQRIFCEEYVIDWNATRSAIAAGYSEKTAQVIGSENLKKPIISDYIELIQQDLAKLAGISALSNINILKKIAEDKKEQTGAKIKAIEVINKMLDLNAPDKQDVNVKQEVTEPVKITFTKK